jgi:uncharacterized RDD family membrane protein YckC
MKQNVIKRLKSSIIDVSVLAVIEIFFVILVMININESFLYIYSLATSIVFSMFFCKDIINGQSIGKRILKLQVVNEKGFPLNLRKVILRNIIALLQPIDMLYMINNNEKRLGDIICKTKVVSTSSGKIKYRLNSIKIIVSFIFIFLITFSFFYVILFVSKKCNLLF